MKSISTITLPSLNGGLNTSEPQYLIADNQSPDMLNVWYKNNTLSKRPGQAVAATFDGPVYKVSNVYNGYRIVHAGGKFYKWDGTAASVICTGIQSKKGLFIDFGDDVYYLDGMRIWQIKPDFSVVAVEPYKPVIMINCKPDLSSGSDYEAFNLIGPGFTVKYNGDGVDSNGDHFLEGTNVYKLPVKYIDSATVQVAIEGKDVTEGYSVQQDEEGIATVEFDSPPIAGQNNVWITAYKTQYEKDAQGQDDTLRPLRNRVLKCTLGMAYGGESAGLFGGTRVFLAGNAEYPFHYWRSDLSGQGAGMSYFPDTSEELLDQNPEPITAMAKMANQLVIFKTNSIFAVGYNFDGKNAYYPVAECQSTIGCDMPGSVQLIDNRLVFGNTRHGIMMLISTSGTLENSVKPLSSNINTLLLKEMDLKSACSADFERYYWLCVNGFVYLWDYDTTPYYNYADYDVAQKRLAWYKFDNVRATEFVGDTSLYYISGRDIVLFTQVRNDFENDPVLEEPIRCYVKTKAFDLGSPHILKVFKNVYPSFSKDGNVKATISVGTENEEVAVQKSFDLALFRWDDWNWDIFTWNVIKFANTYLMRVNIKDAAYIQIHVESNEAHRGLGIAGVRIEYMESKPLRRKY